MQQDLMPGPGLARGGPRGEYQIKIHGPAAFEGMRQAGQLAAATLDFITPHVRAGITTAELDRLCHEFIVGHDAIPAPLNYRGFPKSICTSINHVVCHGIPGDRRLMDGDIVNIDVTVILDGWHGDTSRMYFVGERISVKARKLVDITYEAMMRGNAGVRPGAHIGAIGDAIQRYAERRPLRGQSVERRLDRRDQGPLIVGAVRAHCRRDCHRVRDFHDLAGRAAPPALRSQPSGRKSSAVIALLGEPYGCPRAAALSVDHGELREA